MKNIYLDFKSKNKVYSFGRNGDIITKGLEIMYYGDLVDFTPITSKGFPATSCRISIPKEDLIELINTLIKIKICQH